MNNPPYTRFDNSSARSNSLNKSALFTLSIIRAAGGGGERRALR